MSTQSEILRLQTAKTTLSNKGVELGISLANDKLDAIATKFGTALINKGAVNATVQVGDSYTIPQGYHNGSGVVAGVSGGGNYNLQAKNAIPTKAEQNIVSDEGYYGLSSVTVAPIPTQYHDISGVTSIAADVLINKTFVNSSGVLTAGTMPNNTPANLSMDGLDVVSYTIPKGYHSGTGTVSLSNDIETALAAI